MMAFRSSLRIVPLFLKQTRILSVNSVCSSRFSTHGLENDGSRNEYSGGRENTSRWTLPLGMCLSAVGSCLLLKWNDPDHQFFSSVLAAEPYDSGSGGSRNKFNFVADVVEKVAPTVVSLHTSQITGGYQEISAASGFIVSSDGLIVTNAHAVYNKSVIQATLLDGRTFEARVETMDQMTDLATIRIPCKNLPVLKLGSSDSLRPGEWVISIGSPAGLSNSVSCGVVSTVGRKSTELRLHSQEMEYIQTDAPINQGNSGGPLVNLDGEAVGVNSMKLLHGISFAIPSNIVKEFLEDPHKPHVSSPKKPNKSSARNIGITCLSLTPYLRSEIERHHNYSIRATHGVYIVDVHALSPAMRAGLKGGDVIIAVNNKPIKSTDQLYEATIDNTALFVTVVRGDMKLGLKIELD
ncbi:serine protease HTRA2, mitochondrial [Thrips palmi]|uniref:Serine protease HTRA2, mitochondrial n=1 Tax=Thrips palmi TaxID=161013 RepID=A0A6P8ZV55_THRPL|nr:serine protease HTRA2, mitochondrial [Thrips palmi]